MKRKLYLLFSLITGSLAGNSQTLINHEWQLDYALPDTVEWSASTQDSNNDIIMTGNTYVNGNDLDLLVVKYNSHGTIDWQIAYDHQGGKDAGTDIGIDTNDDVYVCGVVYDTVQANYDYFITKLKGSNGSILWQETYDGSANSEDIPTKLVVDASSGDVYVTGKSSETGTLTDYATIKYDTYGNLQWVSTYDKLSMIDVAAGIVYKSGYVFVTGSAEATASDWDIVTIKYDASNGNLFLSFYL